MNFAEKTMMNNPLRTYLQKTYETDQFLSMGGLTKDEHILEVGCGRGVGVEIILEAFHAKQVDAFDLDPTMVKAAQKRLKKHAGKVNVQVGDVTNIQSPDNHYDSVFNFGIIHHVPDWRSAIKEVHRVLKPGGKFYAEEVFEKFIKHPLWRTLLKHPQHDRFNELQFKLALEENGFNVKRSNQLFGQFGWFIAVKQ